MFREAYRRFLADEVTPNMDEYRKARMVDRSVFKKAGELGFLMVWPDEKYGGMGDKDFRYEQIIIEETSRADCVEFFNTLHSRLVGPYFENLGTEEQKERFLPGCVSGEKILAVAMTEPGAGSDLSGMRSVLKKDGDDYILNGSKTYISNGILADLVVVAAKNEGDDNPYSMTLMIVERGMEGFERGRKLEKMGLDGQDTAELFFNDVRIPKENLLGEPGKGFYHLMEGLAEERLIAACQFAASARRGFDATREFVMERKVFGERLCDIQNTQFRMAELDSEIEMCQVYVDHLIDLHNRGELTAGVAAKAKMLASEIEWKMMDQGVQLHGGAGYMKEYPICRWFTDARVNRILAGSSEIMRHIVGREIFTQKYKSLFD